MNTFNKIDNMLRKSGKKQKELCDYLGISKNRYTDWKAGRVKSYERYIPNIAKFFNITVEDLLSEDEKKPVYMDEPTGTSLSPEEKILLSAYSKATDDDRRVLWTLLDKYLTANEKQYFSQSNQNENIG